MTATAKTKQKRNPSGRSRKSSPASGGRSKTTRPAAESSLGRTAAKVVADAANAVRALFPQREAGDDTATALLQRQHREVEHTFATALDTDDPRIRRSAMNDIIRQLTMHTKIEETIFYPAVRGLGTTTAKDMILEAVEEHHVVKLLLKELPKVDPKAETFEAKMTVLKELIEHHVEEEEGDVSMAERKSSARSAVASSPQRWRHARPASDRARRLTTLVRSTACAQSASMRRSRAGPLRPLRRRGPSCESRRSRFPSRSTFPVRSPAKSPRLR